MISNNRIFKFMLDFALFFGFIASFFLRLTGLSFHQWLGLVIGLFSVLHLILHWKWIKSVTLRFFQKTSNIARVYYVLDLLLFIGFSLILLTGLVISSWLDLWLNHYVEWKNIHIVSSIATLGVLVLKIVLHWRWVVGTLQSFSLSFKPIQTTTSSVSPFTPLPQTNPMLVDRRRFLSLMGFLGASTILAVSNLGFSIKEEGEENKSIYQDSASSGSSPIYPQQPTPLPQSQTSAPLAATSQVTEPPAVTENCVIRCSKQCSYPGSCRRYADNNSNGKCDWGECL